MNSNMEGIRKEKENKWMRAEIERLKEESRKGSRMIEGMRQELGSKIGMMQNKWENRMKEVEQRAGELEKEIKRVNESKGETGEGKGSGGKRGEEKEGEDEKGMRRLRGWRKRWRQ